MTDNQSQEKDRRKYVRLSEEDLIVCETFSAGTFEQQKSSDKFYAFTKNLGEGGILFESDVFFDIGVMLKLEIDIPGWEKYKAEFYKGDAPSGRKPFVVLGKVVRVEDIGGGRFDIGVVFMAVDGGHKMALHKYVEQSDKGRDGRS
ncbi:MAG: hypothetical protein HGA80_07055 [Candidatus Omnitrophica bacterium]|nr:hypothetical protein [Candidatus Omnitrophota bacterium]